MFINKLNSQVHADFQKMSSYVNVFLKTEITCIPKLFSGLFGDYYNNAVCNGASWVFAIWCVLHGLLDVCIDAFLKKLRYREYVRLRLKNGLWYLGFYGTCFVYSIATLDQNNITFFNIKKMNAATSSAEKRENTNLVFPTPLILGHIVISTFYLHSAFWEGLVKGLVVNTINYSLLFFFTVMSYMSRIPEIFEVSMKLTTSIAIAQLALEFTRCYFMSSVQKSLFSKIIATFIYCSAFVTYVLVHLIIIPLVCIVRLGLSIMSDTPNAVLLVLFFTLIAWLGIEIYHSVLFRFVNHWLYHQTSRTNKDNVDSSTETLHKIDTVTTTSCDNTLFECSLFLPRDDVAYHLKRIRLEIEQRRTQMMSLRKPKNMFFQTLKCMVAIKRKLNEKRMKESSESEDKEADSDISESHEAEDSADDESDDEAEPLNSDEAVTKESSEHSAASQEENHQDIALSNNEAAEDTVPSKIFNQT